MQLSVFGLGYVGAVSMACLARDGHRVVGVDIDPLKLEMIRNGRSPIVEEGIQELTAQVVASGLVTVTDDIASAVRDTDVSFVCVGTPHGLRLNLARQTRCRDAREIVANSRASRSQSISS